MVQPEERNIVMHHEHSTQPSPQARRAMGKALKVRHISLRIAALALAIGLALATTQAWAYNGGRHYNYGGHSYVGHYYGGHQYGGYRYGGYGGRLYGRHYRRSYGYSRPYGYSRSYGYSRPYAYGHSGGNYRGGLLNGLLSIPGAVLGSVFGHRGGN